MKEIAETGYWNGETAHLHHIHSQELSDWICDFFENNLDKTKLIIDIGCGLGNYLKDLENRGFYNLVGYEGDPPKNKIFDNIIKRDLTISLGNHPISGNVIFLEVGEHIDQKYQDILLDNVSKSCNNYLITSWAIRGQEGFGHVNCLDNEEIIPEIEKRGFTYLKEESESARNVIKDNTWWFKNTILIFKKNDI